MRELANELRAAGNDVINFAAGELDGDASDLIKEAAKSSNHSGLTAQGYQSDQATQEDQGWPGRFPRGMMHWALAPLSQGR
jgi:aspartate/methionine/tyrosine aminotransferase